MSVLSTLVLGGLAVVAAIFIMRRFSGTFTDILDTGKGIIGTVIGGAVKGAKGAVKWVKGAGKTVSSGVVSGANKVSAGVVSGANAVADAGKTAVGGVVTGARAVAGAGKTVSAGVVSGANKVSSSVVSSAKGAGQVAVGGFNAVRDAGKSIGVSTNKVIVQTVDFKEKAAAEGRAKAAAAKAAAEQAAKQSLAKVQEALAYANRLRAAQQLAEVKRYNQAISHQAQQAKQEAQHQAERATQEAQRIAENAIRAAASAGKAIGNVVSRGKFW